MPAFLPCSRALSSIRVPQVWFVVLLLALPLTVPVGATQPATPIDDGKTRLYVSHGGRFTVNIPVTWRPDHSLVNDLAGADGFFGSSSISWSIPSILNPEDACEFVATDERFGSSPEIEVTTWREMPACIVRGDPDSGDSPVALVFAHPEPATGLNAEFVAVTTSAAHSDAIAASISFDPATITAEAYLDSAIDLIEVRSLVRDRVDWAEARRDAHESLGDTADTTVFTMAHIAIKTVIDKVKLAGGDAHNYFVDAAIASGAFGPAPYVEPSSTVSLDGIGYVSIPAFAGDAGQATRFTNDMHDIINAESTDARCGWIIDLRENTGGDMFPMIYGLAPFLQPGPVAGFRDVVDNEFVITFEDDGAFTQDGMPIAWLPAGTVPSDPVMSQQPFAVLIGPRTVSSGEATALTLGTRDSTRFFGETTGAMATSPGFFPLIDGSMVAVASAWMLGPNGAIHPNGISPDVAIPSVPGQPVDDGDPVVLAAAEWLGQQPGCNDLATPRPT